MVIQHSSSSIGGLLHTFDLRLAFLVYLTHWSFAGSCGGTLRYSMESTCFYLLFDS